MSTGRLTGKVAVVTGASKGIGRATALALGAAGANVVVNYLSSAASAEEVVQAIGADRAIAIQADASDLTQGKALVQKTVEKWGRIDILVLNAGALAEKGALESTTEEDFDRLFKVNVKGPFFLIKVRLILVIACLLGAAPMNSSLPVAFDELTPCFQHVGSCSTYPRRWSCHALLDIPHSCELYHA
jgi:NAD(P)-dependent dehydrogenase (short-subunit alcohol dehydrogenase family)